MARWWSTIGLEEIGDSIPQPLKPALRRSRDLVRGTWPDSVADRRLARTPTDPQTFNEKIRYRIAYDRDPRLTMFADKVAARGYVAERIGEEFLTELHGVYTSGAAVPWSTLPEEYVCKASHGSGAVVIVWEGAPADARLPSHPRWASWDRFTVRPEHASRQRLSVLADKWMTLNYQYGPGRLPEWGYRDIPPRVIVEELLLDESGRPPSDIKFFVFDGVVRMLYVGSWDGPSFCRDLYSRDGERLPVTYGYPRPSSPTPPPASLPRLVEAAEELGRGVDFVRVDLYDVRGRLVFGELTNYPAAGFDDFDPPSFDAELGAFWHQSR